MDSEDASPMAASLDQCCDCGCSCSMMDGSFSGTWSRNTKRKYQERDGNEFTMPGFISPQIARIDIENECTALREMVSNQQQTIIDLTIELDKERNASTTAANEAMSMILRLQSEKAEVQMEFTQFKRFTDERMAHDQQEMDCLEDLLYKREQTIQSLTCEVQMYKHRMLSYGLTESEVDGESDKERGHFSRNNSMTEFLDGQSEVPLYDYPPLKCFNENQVCSEVENDIVDVDKYAFGETPQSRDHLRDLECRLNLLERSPRISHPDGEFYKNNMLEKVIVDQSPQRPRHLRKLSTDSSSTFFATNNEMDGNFITESPKHDENFRTEFPETYEYSNLGKVDNASEVEDDMSDRVYTIDSIHQSASHNDVADAKASGEDFIASPRDSLNYPNMEDPDLKKLNMRLRALEADRESMRQTIISMRTDKAQLVLLKEIAQQICKDMSPARGTHVRKPSVAGISSIMSTFMWIRSLVIWRRRARRCKYSFGQSGNNAGLLVLLNKGPCVGQWRCLTSTQV